MKYTHQLPPQKYLHKVLDYGPLTGDFTWTAAAGNRQRAMKSDLIGKKAGFIDSKGRWTIKIDGVCYQASRLAWVYCYGDSSITIFDEIDHKDNDPLHNWIDNLRVASTQQNQWNKRSMNSLAKGVSADNGGFKASICIDGRYTYLGSYTTVDAAHAAYFEAAKEHFGKFARAE